MINGSLDEILQISLLLICDYNLKAYETIHLFLLSLKNYVHKRYAYLEYPNILLIESSLLDFLRLYMGYVHTNDDFAYKKWISKGVATLEISKQILVKMDESILESNIILLLVTSRFIFEIISNFGGTFAKFSNFLSTITTIRHYLKDEIRTDSAHPIAGYISPIFKLIYSSQLRIQQDEYIIADISSVLQKLTNDILTTIDVDNGDASARSKEASQHICKDITERAYSQLLTLLYSKSGSASSSTTTSPEKTNRRPFTIITNGRMNMEHMEIGNDSFKCINSEGETPMLNGGGSPASTEVSGRTRTPEDYHQDNTNNILETPRLNFFESNHTPIKTSRRTLSGLSVNSDASDENNIVHSNVIVNSYLDPNGTRRVVASPRLSDPTSAMSRTTLPCPLSLFRAEGFFDIDGSLDIDDERDEGDPLADSDEEEVGN